ncbi:MAG: discoidin domain-containing protein, partial [Bacteroidota bacterium]
MRVIAVFAAIFVATIFVDAQVFDINDPVIQYDPENPPERPPNGVVVDWVRTKRDNWPFADNWKAYFSSGMPFRLRFPNNYDPNREEPYPVVVALHHFGYRRQPPEAIYDNETHLSAAAAGSYENALNRNYIDAFVISPAALTGWFADSQIAVLNIILEQANKDLNINLNRVTVQGYSGSGYSVWGFMAKAPKTYAAIIPIAGVDRDMVEFVEDYKHLDIWVFQGELDDHPYPHQTEPAVETLAAAGTNVRYTLHYGVGHGNRGKAFGTPGFWSYMMEVNKTNPKVLNGTYATVYDDGRRQDKRFLPNNEPCPGEPILVTMGLTDGFDGYEWRKDGEIIAGANENEITVTELGTYDARLKRGDTWSEWSPSPVVIKYKEQTITPEIAVEGLASRVLPTLDGRSSVNLELPQGYANYEWRNSETGDLVGSERVLTVETPGEYYATVTENFGCSSSPSPSFTVVDADGPSKPKELINLQGAAISKTEIKLLWSLDPNDANKPTGFEIYRSDFEDDTFKFLGTLSAESTEFTDSLLTPNSDYYYKVRGVNQSSATAGLSTSAIKTQVDQNSPTVPSNLKIAAKGSNSVELSWSESQDDVGVHKYEVYRNSVKTALVDNTEAIIYGISAELSYQFFVKAVDITGNASPESNIVYLNGSSGDLPEVPSGLGASAVSYNQIDLAWTDESADETGFQILRAESASGSFEPVATVGANTTFYSDRAVSPDTDYWYKVVSFNENGAGEIRDHFSSYAKAFVSNGGDPSYYSQQNPYFDFGPWFLEFGRAGFFHDDNKNGLVDIFDPNKNGQGPLLTNDGVKYGFRNNETNLARSGVASQSTTSYGGVASRAIDGLMGSWSQSTVTATSWEKNPYWMVDLGAVSNLNRVFIWNRKEGYGDRLNDFTLEVLDENQEVVYTYKHEGAATYFTNVPLATAGRFVKISLLDASRNRLLSLSEVQVIGTPLETPVTNGVAQPSNHASSIDAKFSDANDVDGDGIVNNDDLDADNDGILNLDEGGGYDGSGQTNVNLALSGDATQSSTGWGGLPERAIDGNTSGRYSDRSVTHTRTNKNQYWMVKLQTFSTINQVVIWNRTDCCTSRLNNFVLEVLDNNLAVVAAYNHPGAAGVSHSIDFGVQGRYVRVRLENYLHLAEVQVFGEPENLDSDNDGIYDYLDLDSDNDGITDLVEAGGTDVDLNGRIDAFVDVNLDGLHDPFDLNIGGEALADLDSDGDNIPNRLDLDSDNDGIEDLVEVQFYAAFREASGTDSNEDGVDDAFFMGFYPIKSDTDALSDYIDIDSDDDGFPDWVEGFIDLVGYRPVTSSTFALPEKPSAPFDIKIEDLTHSSVELSFEDLSDNEDLFEVHRAINSPTNFQVIDSIVTVSNGLVAYQDVSLLSNINYYYKVVAVNAGGSVASDTIEARTLNRVPIFESPLENTVVKHGSEYYVDIFTSDADGDDLTITANNLPSFATFTDFGDGTGSIRFSPSQADEGEYVNIQVSVSDSYDSIEESFDLVVNSNNAPTLAGPSIVYLDEGSIEGATVIATDIEGVADLEWTVGIPDFAAYTVNVDGTLDIEFSPGFADAGTYQVPVTVEDREGAQASILIDVTISEVNPNRLVRVNFTSGAFLGGDGWNNTSGHPQQGDIYANLLDENGNTTNITLSIISNWTRSGSNASGSRTGNDSGLFPDAVMRSAYWTYTKPELIKLEGLDDSKVYRLGFFGSRNASDNRTTLYSVAGQSVTLNAAGNTSDMVELTVNSTDGELEISMDRASGSTFGYLNALVIEEIFDTGEAPAAAALFAGAYDELASNIQLSWTDRAFNESGYKLSRATQLSGPFTELADLSENSTQYIDGKVSANTTYYYQISAYNSYGGSAVQSLEVTVPNIAPVITAIEDLTLSFSESLAVDILVTDDQEDQISISINGLPSFAVFTDNGDGTGSLTLDPTIDDIGLHNLSIVASDDKGGEDSEYFNVEITPDGV